MSLPTDAQSVLQRYALQNSFNTLGNPTVLFEWYLQQHTGTHAHLQVFKLQLGTLSFLALGCNYVGIAVSTRVKG
jgi:hypothetical protein